MGAFPAYSGPEHFAQVWREALEVNGLVFEMTPTDNANPAKRVDEYPFTIHRGSASLNCLEFKRRIAHGGYPSYGVVMMRPHCVEDCSLLEEVEHVFAATTAASVGSHARRFSQYRSTKCVQDLLQLLRDELATIGLSIAVLEGQRNGHIVRGHIHRTNDGKKYRVEVWLGNTIDLPTRARYSFLAIRSPTLVRRINAFLGSFSLAELIDLFERSPFLQKIE